MVESIPDNISNLRERYSARIKRWVLGSAVNRTLRNFGVIKSSDNIESLLEDQEKFLTLLSLYYATHNYDSGRNEVKGDGNPYISHEIKFTRWVTVVVYRDNMNSLLEASQSDNPEMLVDYNKEQ